MRVGRTDLDRILADQEARIRALERAPSQQIYIDDRRITDPVEVVTFTGFPSDRQILELTWSLTTDVDAYICMKFNGILSGEDYRWRLFGDITADDSSDATVGDAVAVIGGSLPFGESGLGPFWGRARFNDYDEPTGAHGIIWQGEGGIPGSGGSNTPDTFLVSGYGDPATPLTQIEVLALVDPMTGANLVAPSRLTLTSY